MYTVTIAFLSCLGSINICFRLFNTAIHVQWRGHSCIMAVCMFRLGISASTPMYSRNKKRLICDFIHIIFASFHIVQRCIQGHSVPLLLFSYILPRCCAFGLRLQHEIFSYKCLILLLLHHQFSCCLVLRGVSIIVYLICIMAC